MKNEEILELSAKELLTRLKEEQLQLTKLKFNHAVSNLDQPSKIRDTRRVIARIKTELSKRKNNPSA